MDEWVLDGETATTIALEWTAASDGVFVGVYRRGGPQRWVEIGLDGGVRQSVEVSGTVRVFRRSPDGRALAYGLAEADAGYRVRDLETGDETRFVVPSPGWKNDARALDWLPDGTLVAARGRVVAHVDPSDGTVRSFERKHTHPTLGVAASPDGRWAVSCDHTQQLRVWDVAKGKQVRRPTGREFGEAAFAPDGETCVQVGAWGGAVFATSGKWESLATFTSPKLHTTAPAFTPDGRALLGSGDALLLLDRNHEARVVATASGAELRAVRVSPDGTWVAATDGKAPRVVAWKLSELDG